MKLKDDAWVNVREHKTKVDDKNIKEGEKEVTVISYVTYFFPSSSFIILLFLFLLLHPLIGIVFTLIICLPAVSKSGREERGDKERGDVRGRKER